MIRQRGQTPQRMLDPKRRQRQRTNIRGDGGPNLLQSERPDDTGIRRDMRIVVPDEARVPSRLISQHDGQNQDQAQNPIAAGGPRRSDSIAHDTLPGTSSGIVALSLGSSRHTVRVTTMNPSFPNANVAVEKLAAYPRAREECPQQVAFDAISAVELSLRLTDVPCNGRGR